MHTASRPAQPPIGDLPGDALRRRPRGRPEWCRRPCGYGIHDTAFPAQSAERAAAAAIPGSLSSCYAKSDAPALFFVGISAASSAPTSKTAALAVALKRRVIVLQGVEAGQGDQENQFENFVRSLRDDQQRINDLEGRIENVLRRLSAIELRTPKRLIDKMMTRKQVDGLLDASYRLRALDPGHSASSLNADLVIEIEKHKDGALLVLPARAGLTASVGDSPAQGRTSLRPLLKGRDLAMWPRATSFA